MGGLLAYIAAEATTALKRKAIVYGLMAVAGLIVLFAAGYAVNAAYMVLVFRVGAVTASLIVAAGLLVLAAALIITGVVMSRRPLHAAVSTGKASPYAAAPYQPPYSKKRVLAVAAALAGALSTSVALIKSKRLRDLLRGGQKR